MGAVKIAAPAWPSFVDTTASRISDMRAATIYERKDLAVIKEHASMAGAAGSLAVDARQFYHSRRSNSAAIDVWCFIESGVRTAWRLMTEYRRSALKGPR